MQLLVFLCQNVPLKGGNTRVKETVSEEGLVRKRGRTRQLQLKEEFEGIPGTTTKLLPKRKCTSARQIWVERRGLLRARGIIYHDDAVEY
jgi:hypothetical protein